MNHPPSLSLWNKSYIQDFCSTFGIKPEYNDDRVVIDCAEIYREEGVHGQPKFIVGKGVIIPGVHTLSNGDPGYPDEYDFEEKGTFYTLEAALRCVGTILIDQAIEVAQEGAIWAKFMDEEPALAEEILKDINIDTIPKREAGDD